MIISTGLPRTGSTSLSLALEILGLKSLHYCMFTHANTASVFESELYGLLRKFKSEYDALISNSLLLYPNSILEYSDYLIITERSDRYNLERSLEQIGTSLLFFEKEMDNQQNLIKKHKRVLVFDVFNGDGWDKLCQFLDKSIPNQPFPHLNKSGNNYCI